MQPCSPLGSFGAIVTETINHNASKIRAASERLKSVVLKLGVEAVKNGDASPQLSLVPTVNSIWALPCNNCPCALISLRLAQVILEQLNPVSFRRGYLSLVLTGHVYI